MADDRKVPTASGKAAPTNRADNQPPSNRAEIDAFLRRIATAPAPRPQGRGRLAFAMDATASREPSWDQAAQIQGDMFRETEALGGLDVQLIHYGGYGNFAAGPWTGKSADLLRRMEQVRCLGGRTQIEKVLLHVLAETKGKKVNALVFVGDCMEEDVDRLCDLAGQLGLLGVPMFLFHEGDDVTASRAFRQMARLTGGACCRFDASSARQLRELLSAVAVYAAGGRKALADYGRRTGGLVLQLTHQMGER